MYRSITKNGKTSFKKVTAATVNAELKRLGFEERLTQGRGYCYFREGRASGWYTSSVPVCYVRDLTLGRWIEEHAALVNDTRNIGR